MDKWRQEGGGGGWTMQPEYRGQGPLGHQLTTARPVSLLISAGDRRSLDIRRSHLATGWWQAQELEVGARSWS